MTMERRARPVPRTLFRARLMDVGQGETRISDDPGVELSATLGSCVAVCLYCTHRKIGGMNHIYQYVDPGPLGDAAVIAEIERLVNVLMHPGVGRQGLNAKVTGGAQVLLRGRGHGKAITDAVLGYLNRERIAVMGVSLGGGDARRVRFHPVTGRLAVLALPLPAAEAMPPHRPGNAPEMF